LKKVRENPKKLKIILGNALNINLSGLFNVPERPNIFLKLAKKE